MKHLLLSFLLLPALIFAQAPTTSFETFDCDNMYASYPTMISSVLNSNDTLFLPTSNFGLDDFAVARTTSGMVLWSIRTIPDSIHATRGGSCILADGNLLIVYTVTINNTGQNLVSKIDRAGHILWERLYGANGTNSMPAVVPTNDGGFIMSGGGCLGGFMTMRCDISGNILWTKVISVSAIDGGTNSLRIVDGGQHLLIAGYFTNGTYNCSRIIKTDLNAAVIWSFDLDFGSQVSIGGMDEIPAANGYVISGSVAHGGHSEPMLLRIDVNGNLLWTKMALQGVESSHGNVMVLPDLTLLAVGSAAHIYANMFTFNCGLVDHYDMFGNLLESYEIPCDTINFRLTNSVIGDLAYSSQTGLIYAAGQGGNIAMLLTILPTNTHTCGSVPLNPTLFTPNVIVTPANAVYNPIPYAMANFFYTEETIPVTFYSDCFNTTTNLEENVGDESISIFPNPTNQDHVSVNSAFDRYEIYDVNGKMVMNGCPNSDGEFQVPDEAGVYFVKIIAGEKTKVKKLIKL